MACREAASAELEHSLLQEVLMALQKLDLMTSGVYILLRMQAAPRGSVCCSARQCNAAEAGSSSASKVELDKSAPPEHAAYPMVSIKKGLPAVHTHAAATQFPKP